MSINNNGISSLNLMYLSYLLSGDETILDEMPSFSKKRTAEEDMGSDQKRTKSDFDVEILHSDDEALDEIGDLAETWSDISRKWAADTDDTVVKYRLETSSMICSDIKYYIEEHMHKKKLVFCDRDDVVEALAVIRKADDYINLYLLATNPESLGTGAGTEVISALEEYCISKNRNYIRVNANSSAVTFYEKIGFKHYKERNECEIDGRYYPMRLHVTGEEIPVTEQDFEGAKEAFLYHFFNERFS